MMGAGGHILRPISGTARYSCSKAAGPARHSCETGRCNPRVSFGGRGGDELLEEADGSAITTPTGDRSVKQVSRTPEGRVRSAAAGGAGRGEVELGPARAVTCGPADGRCRVRRVQLVLRGAEPALQRGLLLR